VPIADFFAFPKTALRENQASPITPYGELGAISNYSSRLKKQHYKHIVTNNYFWRTWEQDEIDFLEEREGKLYVYELKWQKGKSKGRKRFSITYPAAITDIITNNNYLNFIS
jgi:hypothetical protein